MEAMKKRRTLLISCAVILLCVSMVVGGTYALLTEKVVAKNHLIAGTLDVTLERTHLEYTTIDENGQIKVVTNKDVIDFTDETPENIFGLSGETKIVPGGYFQATMKLTNKGDIAFDYSIQVKLQTQMNAFAEQLQVTLVDAEGKTLVDADGTAVFDKQLSELGAAQSIDTGSMLKAGAEYFTVRVTFLNVDSAVNNLAQGQEALFDLIITATQQTPTQQ